MAVLLHLFAMPLMGAGAQMSGMVGHCPMGEANRHDSSHLATHDSHATPIVHASHDSEPMPKPGPAHHIGMPCCCAAGSASLAAIPNSTPELHEPRLVQLVVLPVVMATPLAPRFRWPSLNPRASPLT
ncbi:DUF2946 domain-containing protein [Stutzerimonas stutzeri]|uniref:DUF2946 domain-containing protein n=1 Tax=Stutzerimonas stutzeri TaxID=316 RepID=UPI0023514CA1|nr:DUF2946 domain-containing protein [Stutzerimonas stutzeri]